MSWKCHKKTSIFWYFWHKIVKNWCFAIVNFGYSPFLHQRSTQFNTGEHVNESVDNESDFCLKRQLKFSVLVMINICIYSNKCYFKLCFSFRWCVRACFEWGWQWTWISWGGKVQTVKISMFLQLARWWWTIYKKQRSPSQPTKKSYYIWEKKSFLNIDKIFCELQTVTPPKETNTTPYEYFCEFIIEDSDMIENICIYPN